MWMVAKGTLIGVVIFVVGLILYSAARVGLAVYHLKQAVRSGASPVHGGNVDIRSFLYNPWLWLAFLAAIVIGILIARARSAAL
jgi:hypothetical protein